jgi:hypothetical protein
MQNTRELFRAIYDGICKDQFCLYEQGLWTETYDRWLGEGLPSDLPDSPLAGVEFTIIPDSVDVYRYCNILYPCYLPIYYQPLPSPAKVLEDDGVNRTILDAWGTKLRLRVSGASLPQYLDWPVKTLADWERFNALFHGPVVKRLPVNWPEVAKRIREQTHGIVTLHTIGMFAFPREVMGLEPMLMTLYDNPVLIERMLDDRLEFYFRLYEKPARDTCPDIAFIWEDMSYMSGPLISPDLFEAIMLPRYERLIDFFRSLGIRRIVVDSDGDVRKLIPLWRKAGVNGIMPFEVKAGNDVSQLTAEWPDIVFIGGIDKHEIAKGKTAIDAELNRRLPANLGRGNYIPSLDHWVPPDISYKDYCYYRDRVLNWHKL